MKNYAPQAMELGPRDLVSRAIQTEINEGRGFEGGYVHLDLRHLGRDKILERLPEIRDHCLHFVGVDPIDKPIPIQPGQHYSMGGIDCNQDGETPLPGLFAAGECACVSVHGANRLGGNSLLETIVFGKRAGERACQYVKGKEGTSGGDTWSEEALKRARLRVERLFKGSGNEEPADIRSEMKETMFSHVGIFRDADSLRRGIAKVKELKERYRHLRPIKGGRRFNLDLVRGHELEGMLDLAEAIAEGAMARQESRGSHCRKDFPTRDDQGWTKHTVAHYSPEGPRLSYKEVTVTKWKPEERKY
jgi:succinate dehydrogenase / fumarate reductase flavoprotein subunit